MHLDVGDLQSFYDGQTGRIARRLITERLREVWPNVRGLSVLGLGFATPSNIVRAVYDQLKARGRVRRGTIGAATQSVTAVLADALKLPLVEGDVG